MKLSSIVTMALCMAGLFAGDCFADFKAGMKAYQAGDFTRAVKEFKGDKSKEAQYNLGVMHYKGQGVKADPAQAAEFFRKAGERGHSNAAFLLGNLYDKGEGVKQDTATAAKWYQKAAEKGHIEAQFNLAMMYTNGEGVEKNRTEAVKWLKKAAEKGHARSGKLLGVMGEDIPKAARLQIAKEKGKPVKTPIMTGPEGNPHGMK